MGRQWARQPLRPAGPAQRRSEPSFFSSSGRDKPLSSAQQFQGRSRSAYFSSQQRRAPALRVRGVLGLRGAPRWMIVLRSRLNSASSRSACAMAASNMPSSIGFVRTSTAPAFIALTLLRISARPVKNTIGRRAPPLRARVCCSSRPGMERSSSAQPGNERSCFSKTLLTT